jgi:hypothetical protein
MVTACFCCSCTTVLLYDVDPHCRDHGFDGSRPCEKHNSRGELGCNGHMPASIERYRRDQERRGQ